MVSDGLSFDRYRESVGKCSPLAADRDIRSGLCDAFNKIQVCFALR